MPTTRSMPYSRRAAAGARLMQAVFPAMRRLTMASTKLQFGSQVIDAPRTIPIPTRHGEIPALVYAPTTADLARQTAAGQRPPVHVITHGGAFVVRVPLQEDNVARYLASELGAYVVVPDFRVAPQVRFPAQEEQSFDAFTWVHDHAQEMGWDGQRVSIGGPSAGGKLALSVALMAIDAGSAAPVAVTSEYGVADMTRTNEQRASAKRRPVVGPWMMDMVKSTYFADVDLADPAVSPAFHPRRGELPPTLILTAELDTLRQESDDLADDLAARGVQVTHRQFAGVDHGFTHFEPVDVAREAIEMIGSHLAAAYATDGDPAAKGAWS